MNDKQPDPFLEAYKRFEFGPGECPQTARGTPSAIFEGILQTLKIMDMRLKLLEAQQRTYEMPPGVGFWIGLGIFCLLIGALPICAYLAFVR